MSIDSLKQSLDALGYYTYKSGAYLNVARKVSDEDPRIMELQDFFCAIPLEGDQLKVIYNFGNMPDEEFFDSESQVISFIKKQFLL